MSTTVEQLQRWMDAPEDEHLEFKEAKQNFHFETLVKYCSALANENGGKMVLGVTDKRPRKVVGSDAFHDLERTRSGIVQRLRIRVDTEDLRHPLGRVVIFHVPSRPLGVPIQYEGAYWMRTGGDLIPMTADRLKGIFDETGPDYSAEVCAQASMDDLDPESINEYRRRWAQKSGSNALRSATVEQVLRDSELLVHSGITYAALILFGTYQALGIHLAQAELVFEYRSSERPGPAEQRREYRRGFFSYYDEVWNMINLRNDIQHYQQGLFMRDVPTFNEAAVREAILNAVCHRDYRNAGSVFLRQYSRRLEVVSPGGFPPGITPENILDRQHPRNRRLADAFHKCGLVERAGQGLDRMFEACLHEGKAWPDFKGTDEYQVNLTLHGQLQEPGFLRLLEKVGEERVNAYTTHDLLVLDLIYRGQAVPEVVGDRVARLIADGIVERMGRRKWTLSREYQAWAGRPRGSGLRARPNQDADKALLLKRIREMGDTGARFAELTHVLPDHSRRQVQRLLVSLRIGGLVRVEGQRKAARWYAIG